MLSTYIQQFLWESIEWLEQSENNLVWTTLSFQYLNNSFLFVYLKLLIRAEVNIY